ncbi:hypothetical protein Tco_0452282, partial [Tanacetum coccineum]
MAQNPSSTPGKQVRLADRAAVEKRSFQHTLPAANIQNIDANRDVRRCHVVNRTIISAAENRRSNSASHEDASFCLIVINNTVNRNVKRRFVMNRPDVPIGNNNGNHENINAGLPEFSSAKNQGEASFEQWKIFSVIRPKLRQQVCCSSDGKDGFSFYSLYKACNTCPTPYELSLRIYQARSHYTQNDQKQTQRMISTAVQGTPPHDVIEGIAKTIVTTMAGHNTESILPPQTTTTSNYHHRQKRRNETRQVVQTFVLIYIQTP